MHRLDSPTVSDGPAVVGVHAGESTVKRRWTLFVGCAGVALVIASMIALNTALSDIAVATSATQTQLTWIVDSYTLVLACLLLPAGAIGDRFGRRSALLVGLAIFAVASMAPLLFNSPIEIITARAVAGAGAAFVMPATLSLLTATFPGATHQSRRRLGRCRRLRRRGGVARHRHAVAILALAIGVLGAGGMRRRPVRLFVGVGVAGAGSRSGASNGPARKTLG